MWNITAADIGMHIATTYWPNQAVPEYRSIVICCLAGWDDSISNIMQRYYYQCNKIIDIRQ